MDAAKLLSEARTALAGKPPHPVRVSASEMLLEHLQTDTSGVLPECAAPSFACASAAGRQAAPGMREVSFDFEAAEEQRRAGSYPISRWYLRPAAGWLARALRATPVRPAHLTACGLIAAAAAAAVLLRRAEGTLLAAALVLVAWFFDRADGQLARRQQSASALGAWLDANIDELIDVGLHVAVAWVAVLRCGSGWPWGLLIAFLAGKYLLVYGLATEQHVGSRSPGSPERPSESSQPGKVIHWLRWGYHLPGNADVRVHLLAGALCTGWLTAELALVAAYYNLRWIARYVLVARRLRVRVP